jgi:hypothetical protein
VERWIMARLRNRCTGYFFYPQVFIASLEEIHHGLGIFLPQ